MYGSSLKRVLGLGAFFLSLPLPFEGAASATTVTASSLVSAASASPSIRGRLASGASDEGDAGLLRVSLVQADTDAPLRRLGYRRRRRTGRLEHGDEEAARVVEMRVDAHAAESAHPDTRPPHHRSSRLAASSPAGQHVDA